MTYLDLSCTAFSSRFGENKNLNESRNGDSSFSKSESRKIKNLKRKLGNVIADVTSLSPSLCDMERKSKVIPISRKLKKSTKNKSIVGLYAFYENVLSWKWDDILKNSRESFSLPPLLRLPDTFHNPTLYFDRMISLALEETRASIYQGIQALNSETLSLKFIANNLDGKQDNELIQLQFEIMKSKSYIEIPTYPGWMYRLCSTNNNKMNKKNNNLNSRNNKPSVNILATVRPNPNNNSNVLCLWVHNENIEGIEWQEGDLWFIKSISTVITQQRIFAACCASPSPPFLWNILGGKPSTHIKFGDDDDDNVEGNKLIDEEVPWGKLCDEEGWKEDVNDNNHYNSNYDNNILPSTAEAANIINDVTNFFTQSDDSLFDDKETIESYLASTISIPNPMNLPILPYTSLSLTTLNASQLIALEKCLSLVLHATTGQTVLVQGPPGCGKTHFLVHLLREYSRSNIRVMVCAPSNKAICVALEKFLSLDFPGNSEIFQRCVLVGVEDKLTESSTPYSSLILSDNNSDAANNKNKCTTDNTITSSGSITSTSWLTMPTKAIDTFAYTMGNRLGQAIRYICTTINELFVKEGHILFQLQQKKLHHCHQVLQQIVKRVLKLAPSFYNLNLRSKLLFNSSSVTERFTELTSRFNHYSEKTDSIKLTADSMLLWTAMSKNLLEVAVQLEENASGSILQECVTGAKIIFCTLSSSGHAALKGIPSPDVLLVDEAGQALEADLVVPFQCLPRNLVLVGDPVQLPATLLSMEAQQVGMARSTMERLMSQGCQYPHFLLDTQYRMHPEISLFPNNAFYNGHLIDSVDVTQRTFLLKEPTLNAVSFPRWLQPLTFIDIDSPDSSQRNSHNSNSNSNNSSGSASTRGTSISNLGEANLVSRIVRHLLSRLISRIPPIQILIITFYSAQVTAIICSLASVGIIKSTQVRVSSVDGCQGSEADIVITSFVRSNTDSRIGFLKDFQRLNVALTRAKHMLICVGSARTLTSSSSLDLVTFIKHVHDKNCLFSSEEVLKTC